MPFVDLAVIPVPAVLARLQEFHALSLTIEAKHNPAAMLAIGLARGLPIIVPVGVGVAIEVKVAVVPVIPVTSPHSLYQS
jgi:hypothetical protein